MRDIIFKADEFVFGFRVGGILRHGDKILLQRPLTGEYSMIGGHVCGLETAEETIKREFMEELHAEIEVDNLFCVGENFLPVNGKPCQQICFFYNVHLVDDRSIPLEGTFHGYDDFENERMDLDFCWVPLQELENGLKVYPLEIIPHILRKDSSIGYFLSKRI